MTVYLATYNWQGTKQWATYGLLKGEYQVVYNQAIDVPSDFDFVNLKPITGAELDNLLAMGYEIKEAE